MTQTLFPSVSPAAAAPMGDVCFSPGANVRSLDVADSRDAIIDRAALSNHVQALLSETHLSFRQLEAHSGVPAVIVYRMAQGDSCGNVEVRRFAAFAVHRTVSDTARSYWRSLLDCLTTETRRDAPRPIREATPSASAAAGSADTRTDLTPEDIAALYAKLTGADSREAVIHLLRALAESERQTANKL